ncbi:MAG: S24/S26 family peptidase [Oscillospiraceae bacterium]|nr:S24/S26 family peptidase [Oscillospiraceae bacterium]
MGRAQLDQLAQHGKYLSSPKGISMRPMIIAGRDAVMIEKLREPPKRRDLVMYTRPDLQGVIHRVIRVRADGKYVINGDNCWQLEIVDPENIAGIVTEFCRKGKWYPVSDLRYRIYVRVWTDMLFVRRPLFYVRDKLKRRFGKAKRK